MLSSVEVGNKNSVVGNPRDEPVFRSPQVMAFPRTLQSKLAVKRLTETLKQLLSKPRKDGTKCASHLCFIWRRRKQLWTLVISVLKWSDSSLQWHLDGIWSAFHGGEQGSNTAEILSRFILMYLIGMRHCDRRCKNKGRSPVFSGELTNDQPRRDGQRLTQSQSRATHNASVTMLISICGERV